LNRVLFYGTLILQKEVIKQLSIYKPVRDNRKIHHISSQVISPKILSVANISCYECDEQDQPASSKTRLLRLVVP
jgi:hypothetical protein